MKLTFLPILTALVSVAVKGSALPADGSVDLTEASVAAIVRSSLANDFTHANDTPRMPTHSLGSTRRPIIMDSAGNRP